jgi:DNA-binding response OmpR family regulator
VTQKARKKAVAEPKPRRAGGRILVIDDEPSYLDLVRNLLSQQGYEVTTTTSASEGLRYLSEKSFDLVMLDLVMPEKDGFQVYKEFAASSQVPVLFVTGFPRRFSAKSEIAVELWQQHFPRGTTDVLYKPFDVNILTEKVEGLIGPSGAEQDKRSERPKMKRILIIDDEPSYLEMIKTILTRRGYEVETTPSPMEGLSLLRNKSVDLVLLDLVMPEKDGFEVYKEFEPHQHIPVLFVTGYPPKFSAKSDTVVDLWQREFSRGTTDVLYKPFDIVTLMEKVEGLIGGSGED